MSLAQLRAEVERELTGIILPYYFKHAVDKQYGGIYGRIDNNNRVYHTAPKGSVQHTRLIWTFAHAYRSLKSDAYLAMAGHTYNFLLDHLLDKDAGGLYWQVDFQGHPLVTDKYTYGQAFGIYALAEYYFSTHDERSLTEAVALYRLIESNTRDEQYGGYYEVFQEDWQKRLDINVDKVDGPVYKTMNSHLHLMEAYSNLYRIWPDESLRTVLRTLIRLHLDLIIDPASNHLRLQFAADWTPFNNHLSFGHDIEASWLLVEAAETLGEANLLAECQDMALRMVQVVYDEGIDSDGGLLSGTDQKDKEWWPQAEALVGFLNAYQLSKEPKFAEAAGAIWAYVQKELVDHSNGEWFSGRQANGAMMREEKVSLWKTPYHNGRACLELMDRIDELQK
ncbi:MAG: AGE family epimerase/isomerase [Candidatus Promineifilaceae bacterium]